MLLLVAPVLAASAIEGIDDTGHKLQLATPATRVVTLSPHATDLVIAAGASHRLIAIAPFSRLPEQADPLPVIGGPGALDREALLSLRPDLVVAWHSGNRPADLAWLRANHIPVYASEPADLAQIAESIRVIGRLAGTMELANSAADRFVRGLETPCRELPKKSAYVVIWERPAMTVGGRHWLNSVLDAAGFVNAMHNVDRGVFAINAEAARSVETAVQIKLTHQSDDSRSSRLADLLSRPGPQLDEAVTYLCDLRRGGAGNPATPPAGPSF